MIRIGRLEFELDRAVQFRLRPRWQRYCHDDPLTLAYYGLAWAGELSWLGMVVSLNWYKSQCRA